MYQNYNKKTWYYYSI